MIGKVEICGVNTSKLKVLKNEETMALLNMDESYAERDLNVGFSGGEKKKAEQPAVATEDPAIGSGFDEF